MPIFIRGGILYFIMTGILRYIFTIMRLKYRCGLSLSKDRGSLFSEKKLQSTGAESDPNYISTPKIAGHGAKIASLGNFGH